MGAQLHIVLANAAAKGQYIQPAQTRHQRPGFANYAVRKLVDGTLCVVATVCPQFAHVSRNT
ncbi:hypothetical protein D3C72_2433100 [compost metagenome]